MTTTQDRLKDYFDAVADSVRPDNTRPLQPPRSRERAGRPAVVRGGRRGWRAWAAPLAAAASVLAVIGLAVTLAGHVAHRSSPPQTRTTAPFRYYATAEGNPEQPVVRSVSSGAVIARVPNPRKGSLAGVATADDRTFYATYVQPNQYAIYSFRVLGQGKVTGLTAVKGGVVPYTGALDGDAAPAVSPDGANIALPVTTQTTKLVRGPRGIMTETIAASEVVVTDLRTGAQHVWRGGLDRAGHPATITSVSWADNGRSLDFVAAWCGNEAGPQCLEFSPPPEMITQVRALEPGANGGSLDDSRVLITEPGFAEGMVAAPGGRIDLLMLSGASQLAFVPGTVTIGQYSAVTGALESVLYRHDYDTSGLYLIRANISADSSGRYPLLALGLMRQLGPHEYTGDRTEVGWIHDGTFQALKSDGDWQCQAAW